MPSLNSSRRHRKHSTTSSTSSKKKHHPPDLSLSNRYSSGSNNSTSDTQATPTSRSIFSSSFRSSRRGRAHKDANESGKHTPVTREDALGSHPPVEPSLSERRERRSSTGVDVFEYMEVYNGGWDSPPDGPIDGRSSPSDSVEESEVSPPILTAKGELISQPLASPHYSDLEVEAPAASSGRAFGRSATLSSVDADGVLHSDSGVSVHSGSPEEDNSPVMKQKYLLQPRCQPSFRSSSPNGLIEPSILEDDEPQSAILQRDSPDFSATNPSRSMHRHVTSLETSEGWVPEACVVSPSPTRVRSHSRSNWADGAQVDDFSLHSPTNYAAPQPRRRSIYTQSHLEIPAESFDAQAHEAYISPCPLPNTTSTLPHQMQSQEQQQQKKTGYALLASKIAAHAPTPLTLNSQKTGSTEAANNSNTTDHVLRPIYRKFETLQNRMLLYLQDEISELESQLHDLDSAISIEQQAASLAPAPQRQHSSISTTATDPLPPPAPSSQPESRRLEAKLPTQLQWHRMDLLTRLSAKLDQYTRALTSYATLTRTLSPASVPDLESYRAWIETHAPVAEAEVQFLHPIPTADDAGCGIGDLVSVNPPPPAPSALGPQNQRAQSGLKESVGDDSARHAGVLASAFVATVVMFNIVPAVSARMVLSSMVGVAALCLLSEEPFRWERWRERGGRRGKEVGLWVAVMGLLACVVR